MLKKKRGRKPKSQLDSTTRPTSPPPTNAPQKSKRGRKPKNIYSSFDNTTMDILKTSSEDENIILQLSVGNCQCDMDNDIQSESGLNSSCTFPDAYNEDFDNSFLSKPYEIERGASIDDEIINQPMQCNQIDTNLKVIELLKDFEEKNKNNEWPLTTSIHCYWCCHKFNNPPFGIPVKLVDKKFHVFGCFCSLECAAAFNFASNESMDEVWERFSLINMLSKRIAYKNVIKPAPNRLALKMFGGHLGIDEFRTFCETSKIINIHFPPMMTITQQVEEINDCDINSDYKFIPIDSDRINKYKEKITLKRNKPVTNFKNTLDHTMNIKFTA